MMPLEDLRQIVQKLGDRTGWDFSRVKDDRDPVPWEYEAVVRRYVRPGQHVLDIGTGGGERFIALAEYFGTGIGVDISANMVATAQHNLPVGLRSKLSFAVMPAQKLEFAAETFDVVLNRHAALRVEEVIRVLKPGGYFITQQVGAHNMANICARFGCGPGGEYAIGEAEMVSDWAAIFRAWGCVIRARAEYDVPYYFRDVESLLFVLKAVSIPQDFDIDAHWQAVDEIVAVHTTPRGIETNEHRELLIVQKPQS
ncbi:MAG: class I SAM-dependent methyltransferase [Chloroflexi bacterium]|nr:class I SAM-dependent methyltransferase [Chloroflexota bacterium]